MDAGTIAVLVMTVIFIGSIAGLEIHSRRQAARKGPATTNSSAEKAAETQTPTNEEMKKRR